MAVAGSNPAPAPNTNQKHMKNNGYRGMIRDRMPYILDVVLRYYGAKNKWINHVYDNFVKIFKSNEDKDMAVRVTLGISSRYSIFLYNRSIEWTSLDDEEKKFWKSIGSVYEWLRKYHLNLETSYKSLLREGNTLDECVKKICKQYHLEEYVEFVRFILEDLNYK